MNRVIDRGLGGWREPLFLRANVPGHLQPIELRRGLDQAALPAVFGRYRLLGASRPHQHPGNLWREHRAQAWRRVWWRTLGSQCSRAGAVRSAVYARRSRLAGCERVASDGG